MATTKPPKNHKYKYQLLIMEGDVKLITHVRYYSILRFHLPVKKQNNPSCHGNGGEQVASLRAGPQRVTKHINHRAYLNMSLSKVPLLVGDLSWIWHLRVHITKYLSISSCFCMAKAMERYNTDTLTHHATL